MSKPKRKRATAPKPLRQPIPDRRGSTAPTEAELAELDDDIDNVELKPDEALSLFLRGAPVDASRFVVVAVSHRGEEIVQDRPASECRMRVVPIAKQVLASCARWAHAEGHAVRFRASWNDSEQRAIASFQWKDGRDARELDGTVESFLAQSQRHMENREQLSFERAQIELESFKTLIGLQNKRIEALETDNQDLRDRLRKLDDVSSEIAITQMQQDVAARGRTAELLEKRVFPIAQALLLQQMQAAAGSASAATPIPANGGK